MRLFNSNDRAPVSSAMSLVGSDLNGEKLKEFMYHFEQSAASIYNKNLHNEKYTMFILLLMITVFQ